MHWNRWIRQTHRWLSMAFTAAILINLVAILRGHYTRALGVAAVVPLALLFLSGMYLFVLPYAAKWRTAGRAG